MTTTERPAKARSKIKTRHVSLLLDASGSMRSIWDATIESFNAAVKGFQGDPHADAIRLTLTDFDTSMIRQIHRDLHVHEVPELTKATYVPRGGTPLFDAVARVIADMEQQVKGERNPHVLIDILTDGLENSSMAYDAQQIAQLIEERQSKGWTFTYLGANQDAWQAARSMGIPASNAANFTSSSDSVRNLSAVRSAAMSSYMAAPASYSAGGTYAGLTTNTGFLVGDEAAEPKKPEHTEPKAKKRGDAWSS